MKIKLERKTGTYTYLDGNNLYQNSVLVHEILLYTDIYPEEVPYIRISGQGVETEDMVMSPVVFNIDGVIESAYKITIPNAIMSQTGKKTFAVSLKKQINESAAATLETFSNGVFTVVESLAGVDFENVPYDAIDELVGDLAETITKIDEIIEANKTIDEKISEHNTSADAHQEALKHYVPTARTINGKSLNQDIALTAADVGADVSGRAAGLMMSHQQNGYYDHPDIVQAIPKKVSDLPNDAGYITQAQSIDTITESEIEALFN